MANDTFLFIIDSEAADIAARNIWAFSTIEDAEKLKNRFVQKLCTKYPRNEFTVVETIAREFVARFRVPKSNTRRFSVINVDGSYAEAIANRVRDFERQFILRIETGTLINYEATGIPMTDEEIDVIIDSIFPPDPVPEPDPAPDPTPDP